MASGSEALLGQIIDGRWEVVRLIRRSNFGAVYEGRKLPSGEPCAIKILESGTSSPSNLADFDVEGDLLELLAGCTQIIDLLGRGRHRLTATVPMPGGRTAPIMIEFPYIVLELADASLADLIAYRHRLPWPDRLELFRDITKGLHQMHQRRVVNRDVKSDNVLVLGISAKRADAKISDLGRSRDTRSAPRVAAEIYDFMRGDPAFSAPELIWGLGSAAPDSARLADLYLLGSVLFEFGAGVGLTALAVPDPLAIVNAAAALSPAERQREYAANLTHLRQALEVGYAQFEEELPNPIRHQGAALLRILTDVEPQAREPQSYSGRALAEPWDLQWILRRIDRMLHQLAIEERQKRDWQVKAERRRRHRERSG
jgi:serine/threonine protein kinase